MSFTSVIRLAGVAATGATVAYLFDPTMGRSRRARLGDRIAAGARTAIDRAGAKARYQRGVAQGMLHRVTEPWSGETDIDDDTLLQKVRSEALGRWQGPGSEIEIDVDQGVVTLRGPVRARDAEDLVARIERVRGVDEVRARFTG